MKIYAAHCTQCGHAAIIAPTKMQHMGFWGAGYHRCTKCGTRSRTTYHPSKDAMTIKPLFKRDKK